MGTTMRRTAPGGNGFGRNEAYRRGQGAIAPAQMSSTHGAIRDWYVNGYVLVDWHGYHMQEPRNKSQRSYNGVHSRWKQAGSTAVLFACTDYLHVEAQCLITFVGHYHPVLMDLTKKNSPQEHQTSIAIITCQWTDPTPI